MTDPGPDDVDEPDGGGDSAGPDDRVDGDQTGPGRYPESDSPETGPGSRSSGENAQGHDTPVGSGDDPDPSPTIGVGGDRPEIGPVREPEQDSEEEEWLFVARDLLVTVLAVLLVGGYLFAISGVWPPMVAIESGSMEPNMNVNDMVFVVDEERFQPADATGNTGVVTAQIGDETGYGQFGGSGDVIIFEPGGNGATTPIIHRAMFWAEEGENWCEMADPAYLGRFEPTDAGCVAPHDGFITKGDANPRYDQASFGESGSPVKPEWIVGTAELRVPRLGWFRLQL